jgi:hypothetical protein
MVEVRHVDFFAGDGLNEPSHDLMVKKCEVGA